MSLGKPVVATKPGGPEEIITDGRDGLLVPFGKPILLARAISRFLNDPDLAGACASAAALRAREFAGDGYPRRVQSAIRDIFRSYKMPQTSVQAGEAAS